MEERTRTPRVGSVNRGVLWEAPVGGRHARLVSRAEMDSDLFCSVCWLEPGEETKEWSTESQGDLDDALFFGEVHEVYFVVNGRMRLTWDDGRESCEFSSNDAVHLPPGLRYRLANIGDVPAFLVYWLTPSDVFPR